MNTIEGTIIPAGTEFNAPAVGARKIDVGRGGARFDVSKQWISRPADQKFLNLSDLRAHVAGRRERSTELRIGSKGIEFITPEIQTREDTHRLTVGLPGGREVAPTHWSFGQLAGLAKAPAGYLRDKLPSPIAADCLNWGFRENREIETIKTYDYDGQLYAATGPDYGRIFDLEVVEAVQAIAGNGTGDERWKVPGVLDWRTHVYDPFAPVTPETTTLFASDRDIFIFLVDDLHPIEIGKLRDGSPDYVFRGFYITNSEVGSGALKIACFYLRGICCNRILWGVEGFEELKLIHSKSAPDRFIEQARPALESFASGSVQRLLDGVEKAKAAKVAEDEDQAIEFLRNRGFAKKRTADILEAVEREEGRKARTVWDFAQGITAVARDVPNTDDRLSLELEAKKILDKVA